jgi:hypothetical protein
MDDPQAEERGQPSNMKLSRVLATSAFARIHPSVPGQPLEVILCNAPLAFVEVER